MLVAKAVVYEAGLGQAPCYLSEPQAPAGAAGGRANGERGMGGARIRAAMGGTETRLRDATAETPGGSPGPDTGMPRCMAAWRDLIPDYATRTFRSPAAPTPRGLTGSRPAAVGLGPDANTAEAAPMHGATPGRRMIQAARAWHAQVCPHTARHPGMRGDWQKDSDEDRAVSHSISRADARISPLYRGPSGRCRLCRALPVIPHCSGAVTGRAAGRVWLVSGTRQSGMLSSTPQKEPERVHTY